MILVQKDDTISPKGIIDALGKKVAPLKRGALVSIIFSLGIFDAQGY